MANLTKQEKTTVKALVRHLFTHGNWPDFRTVSAGNTHLGSALQNLLEQRRIIAQDRGTWPSLATLSQLEDEHADMLRDATHRMVTAMQHAYQHSPGHVWTAAAGDATTAVTDRAAARMLLSEPVSLFSAMNDVGDVMSATLLPRILDFLPPWEAAVATVTSLQVQGFRGIRGGILTGLKPLTVLVGANASGKSTILDAMNILFHPDPGWALGQCVVRRRGMAYPRWLFPRGADDTSIHLAAEVTGGAHVRADIRKGVDGLHDAAARLKADSSQVWLGDVSRTGPFGDATSHAAFVIGGVRAPDTGGLKPGQSRHTVLYDSSDRGLPAGELSERRFSALIERGQRPTLKQLTDAVLPEGSELQLLTETNQEPFLAVVTAAGAVPVRLAGEGVVSAVEMGMLLAQEGLALALLEEPEAHMHPRTLWQLGKVITRAVIHGVQVVLTTHSLEMLDALLASDPEGMAGKAAVLRVALQDGTLQFRAYTGEAAREQRSELEEDLR